MKTHTPIIIFISLLLVAGCSLQKLTIRAIHPVIENSLEALFEEGDLQIARSAIEADLKLLDGLLKTDPENRKLLFVATQGYTSYALGFAEDESIERARYFYLRARDYGLQLLKKDNALARALSSDLEHFQTALKKLKQEQVPEIFWTANAWGNWINLSMTNPDALADLPRVQSLMERVLELDEGYFYGGAHLFLGTINMVKPMIMGGNPDRAKQHFKRCLHFCQDQFLLPYVYYARYYAVRTLDEELFQTLLDKVQSTSLDILPEQRLPNAIAKHKAQLLLAQKSELF